MDAVVCGGVLRDHTHTHTHTCGVIDNLRIFKESISFLAQLRRRLLSELIVYTWSGVHLSSATISNIFSETLGKSKPNLFGASFGRGNESLASASGSHDQDVCHAHMIKTFKNLLLRSRWTDFHETWYMYEALGTPAHHKFVQMMILGWPWPILRQGRMW